MWRTASSTSGARTRRSPFRRWMIWCTSSRTPRTDWCSWTTPSIRKPQTAVPRSEDRSIRRRALPRVWPKPRSSGWRRNSAAFGLSSRRVISTRCGRTNPVRSIAIVRIVLGLLGVQLDDELFLRRGRDRLAGRALDIATDGLLGIDLQPGDWRATGGKLLGGLHGDQLAALGRHADLVAREHGEGGHVDAPPVHLHVAVADELARRLAAGGEAHPVDEVVQPGLEGNHEVGALDARVPGGLDVEAAELALREAVEPLHLLLLAQLLGVLRGLAPAGGRGTVLAGGVPATLDRALLGE